MKRRAWPWVLLGVGLLLAAIRLALTPIAAHLSHRALDSMGDFRGDFDDVSLSLLRLRYRIRGLRLKRSSAGAHEEVLRVDLVEGRLRWRELWHLRLAGILRLDGGKATYVLRSRAQLHDAILGAEAFADLPDLGGLIEGLIPFRITRVEVRNGEALVIDQTEQGVPAKSAELWVHDIEATVENFGSRGSLLQGEPTTLALEAALQRSGGLSLFMTMDPLAYKLDFEGEARVRHLRLEELYGFVVGLTALKTRSGVLDAYATFRCDDGQLEGELKPMVSNLELAPTKADPGNQSLSTLANVAVAAASDHTSAHEVGTTLHFGGAVRDPKARLWPALADLLGAPVKPGFVALPPERPATAPATPATPGQPANRQPRPLLSTSPQAAFGRGAVERIQAALAARGFAASATGALAGPTVQQLIAFQKEQGLPETGFPDRETLRQLGFGEEDLLRSPRAR